MIMAFVVTSVYFSFTSSHAVSTCALFLATCFPCSHGSFILALAPLSCFFALFLSRLVMTTLATRCLFVLYIYFNLKVVPDLMLFDGWTVLLNGMAMTIK